MAQYRSLPAVRHSVPSPDGSLVATLQRTRLLVRSITANELVQSWSITQDFVTKCLLIRWHCTGRRILLADGQNVRIFDVDDPKWKACIEGAASNLGQLSDVAFGHSADEVLVFSDFGVKITIWSLVTSRGVEVRDPKYGQRCYGVRPKTGHLAFLTRPAAQDVLMLLEPSSHEVVKSVELSTVDAQEVSWSHDGNWIAVRDAASLGHKVQMHTADGHLFRTFSGMKDAAEVDLGVKSMVWSPTGSLILGDYNGRVVLLCRKTYTPLQVLYHKTPVELPHLEVWEEQIKANTERTYASIKGIVSPPTSGALAKTNPPKQGISILALNNDGTMLATRDDAVPTTTWLWSMQSGKLITMLIHHSSVKHLEWHPYQKDLLLVHCAIQEPIIHIWKSNWIMPLNVTLPLPNAKGKLEAHWVQSKDQESFSVLFSSSIQTINARISLAGDLLPEDDEQTTAFNVNEGAPEDMFDEGNSLDLSPVKYGATEDFGLLGDSGFGTTEHAVDDTFHYRKQVKAGG